MAAEARKKKKETKNENSSRCRNFNSLCFSPSNFYREKKINKWYQSQSVNTHNLLKNQSQFTQKPTNGTNLKNQQNLLKA